MCDDRERLLDYVYDECGADERRRVEAHVAACEECREEIAGLRAARQDLLAWDVPDHESVWKPFVSPRATPSWRDVPAWALAAAASAMFLLGAAGGVVTHAFVAHETGAAVQASPVQAAQLGPAAVTPVPAGVNEAELGAIEQRLLRTMRSELASRVQLVSAHGAPDRGSAASAAGDPVLAQLAELAKESQAQLDLITGLSNRLGRVRTDTDNRIAGLERIIDGLRQSQQTGK